MSESASSIFRDIEVFYKCPNILIPTPARDIIRTFLESSSNLFAVQNIAGADELPVVRIVALSVFLSEFDYYISDFSFSTRKLSERAFVHLQRSIIADDAVGQRWRKAFEDGEPACEKLGATHLLQHGIWAFKASGEGERTDLVMGDRLTDFDQVARSAEALVLTEWKVARQESEITQKIEEAKQQADRYSCSILWGVELANYRYLVIVTDALLRAYHDIEENGIVYRIVYIAANPPTPSADARKKARGGAQ